MTDAEIVALIKSKLTVKVEVYSGPDVQVLILWDGEVISQSQDGYCDGDQGGPQA